jgi:imidazolonepropionase-like amidohydrolase
MKPNTLPALIGAVLIGFAAIAAADNHDQPVTVIDAGRVIDVETGRALTNQRIVVRGERIEAIGPIADTPVPDGAPVVDLTQATVLPGLMDAHVHLAGDHDVHGYRRLTITTPGAAISGVINAEKTLMAGFTTVRNVGAPAFVDVALRDAIAAGRISGPTLLAAGPSLGITGGHCDNNLLPYEYADRSEGVADGPWGVRTAVRRNIKYGADLIKFCGTGGVLSKGTRVGAQQYTLEEMQALVDEAHLHGRKVAVHAHGTDGIKAAIRAGVDSVEHASFIDDEGIRLAKANGVYLSMDIYVSDFILSEGEAAGILAESLDKERTVGKRQRDNFERAVRAGVLMAYGTDAGVYPHGQNARQLAYLVRYGMNAMEAIRTATLNTASLFGIEDQTGSLAVGKHADIIAVYANPLDDIRALERVSFVMKRGEIFKHDSP